MIGDDSLYFFYLEFVFQVFEVSVVVHFDGVDAVDPDLSLHGSVAGFYLASLDVSYLNCCFEYIVFVFFGCFGVGNGVDSCGV